MTDKVQKIREEVEMVVNRRLNLLNGDYFDLNEETNGFTNEIMDIIDSLQKEPVSKEIGDYDHKAVMESLCPQLKEEPTIPDIVDEHFWKMLGEEPVSEELEEACEQLAENARKHKAETSSPFFSQTDYRQGVIDGAKWQKEQLMAKAVDATVHIDAGGYPYIQQMELYDYDKDVPLAKEGDKYIVVLIKED